MTTKNINDNAANSGPPIEQHYKVPEVAKKLGMSDSKVRALFKDDPAVLALGEKSRLLGGRTKRYKRHYSVLYIPESALRRVMAKLMDKRPPGRSDDPILDRSSKRNAG
jgi:hypothetical protein